MYVLVDDRQRGKTTKLVQWLLEGEPRANYPGWSRIIVCPDQGRVVFVTDMVKKFTQGEWNDLAQIPDDAAHSVRRRAVTLANIRKAVWSLDELRNNSFGGRMEVFDYALDDAELMLGQYLRVHKAPEVITMTGQAWT